MSTSPFKGKWICEPRFADILPKDPYHKQLEPPRDNRKHPTELCNVHTLFRRRFALNKKAGRYLLRFSADDYGKVYVNGVFVGQGPTTGFLTAYHFNEIDITDKLCSGDNEILIHAYYQGLINHVWTSGDFRSGVIADLIAPDGDIILSTDEAWECAPINNYTTMRVIGYKTQYLEDYDSRIPPAPFNNAALRVYDDIIFRSAPTPMLQIYDVVPKKIETLPGGIFYDFGQEITGTLQIHAIGQSGDTIRILCGEETDNSEVKVRYSMRCNCEYDETWTLCEGENHLDQYDYKAFRYVTLIPSAPSVKIEKLTAVIRHAPFNDGLCTLKADDPILESVFCICKNGVKYGTQEVYVDCPSREKGQYAGDMTVTSGSQLWLTGDIFMLEKGIRDQAHSAFIDKGLMAVMGGGLMQEIADYSLQFPLLLLRYYGYTGDKEFLSSMLPIAENMIAHFEKFAREDGLLDGVNDKWNLVDWPENLRDGYDFTLKNPIGSGVHNVINAFYIGCVKNVEEIKYILGIPYKKKSERLAEAFNRVFYRPKLGLYVDAEDSSHSSLHSNILPVFYDIHPKKSEDSIGSFLVKKGLVCGVYMSYFLMRALCRLGRFENAYRLIVSTDENSWYNMVREGGTTCFEAWGKDKKWNTSLCHPWASSPIIILIEELMNVSLDGTVGEHRFPKDAGRIEMTIPTPKGVLTVTANG